MTQDDKKVIDRFEERDNVCDRCIWMEEVEDDEFPCSHCVHNPAHVKGAET